MNIARTVRVLIVPADVLRDVEVRRRERAAKELEARRARAGFQRIVETSARSAGLPRWLMRLDLTSAS